MTTIYFVRHAQPNYDNHNDLERELTANGLEDRKRVTTFLLDKSVDVVLSSPYKRSFDTVKDFADRVGLPVGIVPDFRERKVESVWIDDFESFCKQQWADFSYKLSDGESLREVQERNIAALQEVLAEHKDQTIVIGTHGTALSTILNYYDPSFGYNYFQRVRHFMPWIVKMAFDGECLIEIAEHDVFEE
ncbi:MAG: histidine phosphatase family protein [Clostridia bacterium]|nr:histidine phosphatase family protein [Clostridia bacterium]